MSNPESNSSYPNPLRPSRTPHPYSIPTTTTTTTPEGQDASAVVSQTPPRGRDPAAKPYKIEEAAAVGWCSAPFYPGAARSFLTSPRLPAAWPGTPRRLPPSSDPLCPSPSSVDGLISASDYIGSEKPDLSLCLSLSLFVSVRVLAVNLLWNIYPPLLLAFASQKCSQHQLPPLVSAVLYR